MESSRTTVGGDLEVAGAGFARAAAAAQRSIAQALFGARGCPPAIAGRYRLAERLGAGAQGAVWRAYDESLAREVAIKTAHVAGSSGLARAQIWLRHEAKMLGRVSHPNVVAVFDVGIEAASAFGADDDGAVIFVVLELVRGRTLAQWLNEKVRTPAEIAAVFVEVAAGLQAVHDAGLVHCDVKPGNILVTEHGVAKLGDFGLAHAQRLVVSAAEVSEGSGLTTSVADASASQPAQSATAPHGGTPAYMPPEQFHRARVDARADQYALAGTWFEAVFGTLPHGLGTHMALLEAKLAGPPARPSTKMPLFAFRALARGLARDPRDRHASVVELARAVTRRDSPWTRAAAVAAVAVAVGLSFGTTTATRPGCRERQPDDASRFDIADHLSAYDEHLAHRVSARWDEQIAAQEQVRRSICAADEPDSIALACLDRVERLARGSIEGIELRGRRSFERTFSVLERLPDPADCLADPSTGAPEWAAEVDDLDAEIRRVSDATMLASRYSEDGRHSDALALLALVDVTSPAGLVFANEMDLTRAGAAAGLGRLDQATAAYQVVWDRSVAGNAPLDAARAAGGLAYVIGYERRDHDTGLAWIRHGKSQLARFGAAPLVEMELLGVEGTLLGASGDYEGGLVVVERALVVATPVAGEASIVGLEENAALLEVFLGRIESADARLRRVLAWREDEVGPVHADVARSLLNLAFVEHRRENLDAASALLARALEIHETLPEPPELERARVYSATAGVAVSRGDLGAAIEALTRADEIRTRVHGPSHPDLGASVLMRLDLLLQAGDIAAAEALTEASRDRLAQAIDPTSDEALDLEHMLARVDGMAGRHPQALARMVALLEVAATRSSRYPQLARWSVQTAAIAGASGQLAGAEHWAKRAEEFLAAHGGDDGVRAELDRLHMAIAAANAEIAARQG